MTVRELNRNQLDELKQTYAIQLAETDGEEITYGELIDATEIPDEVIFNHYDGIDFSEDDFFCSKKMTFEDLKEYVTINTKRMLSVAISDDYINYIVEEIIEDVINDVATSSAFKDEGYFNEDDIRLAIGRVLISKMNINY